MGNRSQQIGELFLDEDGGVVYCTKGGRHRSQVIVVNDLTFLSPKDASAHFQFSPTYVYHLLKRGSTPDYQIRHATWEEAVAKAEGRLTPVEAPAPVAEDRPKSDLDRQIEQFHADRALFLQALHERERELVAELARTRKQIEGLVGLSAPPPMRMVKVKGK